MDNITIFHLAFSDNLRERAKKKQGPVAESLIAVADALNDTLEDAANMNDMVADFIASKRVTRQ